MESTFTRLRAAKPRPERDKPGIGCLDIAHRERERESERERERESEGEISGEMMSGVKG